MKTTARNIILALAPVLLLSIGCQHTADGLEKDAEKNKAQIKTEAKEAKEDIKAGAEKAAEAVGDAADAAALQAAAAKATLDVKTSLMASKAVDASRIDVDSDAATKIVHLRGKVTTQAEIDSATAIAKESAAGWTISNELAVAPKS